MVLTSIPDTESGESKGFDFFLTPRRIQRYLSQLLKPKEREVTAAAKSRKRRFLFFSMPYQKRDQKRQHFIKTGHFYKKARNSNFERSWASAKGLVGLARVCCVSSCPWLKKHLDVSSTWLLPPRASSPTWWVLRTHHSIWLPTTR